MKTRRNKINLIGAHFMCYNPKYFGEWEVLKSYNTIGTRWVCKNAEHDNVVIPYIDIMKCERW